MSAREERLYAEEIGFILDDMIGRFAMMMFRFQHLAVSLQKQYRTRHN